MALTCNIDSRGKAVRLIYGLLFIAAAVVLMFCWARGSGSIWRWLIAAACLVARAFAVFEARKCWCVVRAMGFKTPV